MYAHLHIEQEPANAREKRFIKLLSKDIAEFKGDDCRELYSSVKARSMQNGIRLKMGAGGSHIWLSREKEFVQDDIHASKRFAIILDGKPDTAQSSKCVYCLNQKSKP